MSTERSGPPHGSDPRHLDDETLERFAAGELSAIEQARVQRHASGCSSCAALLNGLTQLRASASRFDPGVPRTGRSRARPVWVPIAAAAALATVVLLPMLLARRSPPASVTRDASPNTPVAVAPIGTVAALPARFEWRPSADATTYEWLLFREDGTLLRSQRSAVPFVETPANLELTPGRYYWRVRALSDDRAPAESPLTHFEITRP